MPWGAWLTVIEMVAQNAPQAIEVIIKIWEDIQNKVGTAPQDHRDAVAALVKKAKGEGA